VRTVHISIAIYYYYLSCLKKLRCRQPFNEVGRALAFTALPSARLPSPTIVISRPMNAEDRLSESGGCRLPGTKRRRSVKNLLVLGGSAMC